jgi:hypothetical protein
MRKLIGRLLTAVIVSGAFAIVIVTLSLGITMWVNLSRDGDWLRGLSALLESI